MQKLFSKFILQLKKYPYRNTGEAEFYAATTRSYKSLIADAVDAFISTCTPEAILDIVGCEILVLLAISSCVNPDSMILFSLFCVFMLVNHIRIRIHCQYAPVAILNLCVDV